MKKIIIGGLSLFIILGFLVTMILPVKAWNHPTHTFITEQAWEIFNNDNKKLLEPFKIYQAYVPDYLDKLIKGVLEADVHSTTVSDQQITIKFFGKKYTLYMPTSEHYYNPKNGQGAFKYFLTAKQKAEEYYNLSLQNWEDGEYDTSVYNLGRAMHMVQDVTLPHHTFNDANALLNQLGYSDWLDKHYNEYVITSGATYNVTGIGQLIHSNASISQPMFKYVDGLNPWWIFKIYTKDDYGKASQTLLPLAQKTCAGLLYKYANDVLTIEASKVLQNTKVRTPRSVQKFE